ncbi:MAG: class I mannose-6-phosphate isomerase [Planctomycetes bacterium]|nr:class I mannose-6-phosphate isomerase [Planctomycetota bacterium]
MTLAPFRTAPRFVSKPWGGGPGLAACLGRAIEPSIGEAWLVSDVPGEESEVLDGPYAGHSLREVIAHQGEALLGKGRHRFPLLIKLLEIRGRLSVQVHPDAAVAQALGDGARGKSEAWYLVEAGPQAQVWQGFAEPVAPAELAALSTSGAIAERLNRFVPEPGEAVEILPGTFHTAEDVLVLEVQETSDVTYRVYDWGRTDRALHLEQATACLEQLPAEPTQRRVHQGEATWPVAPRSPFTFEVWQLAADEVRQLPEPGFAGALIVLSGELHLRGGGPERLAQGDALVLPATCSGLSLHSVGPARLAYACALPAGTRRFKRPG